MILNELHIKAIEDGIKEALNGEVTEREKMIINSTIKTTSSVVEEIFKR